MTGLCPIHNVIILIIPKQGIEMQFFPKQAVEIPSKNGHLTVMLHSTTPPSSPGRRSRKSKMVNTATISIFANFLQFKKANLLGNG